MELTPSGLSDFTKSAYRTDSSNKIQQPPSLLPRNGCKKKYSPKILIARNWEGNLTQLSPLRKDFNHQKTPQCSTHPHVSSICCWPLEEDVALRIKETKAFCMQIDLRCWFTHLTSMLLAGSRRQNAQIREILHHSIKMIRLLVQKRRGRHPQISSGSTCCLQSLSKVSKSLLYTATVITVA